MRRRLNDQVLILQAIRQVRAELVAAKDGSWLDIMEIMLRLSTLYSLLDVRVLEGLATVADSRESKNKKEAA